MCPAPTTAERTTSEADLPNEAPWAGGYPAWAREQLERQTGAPVGRLVACSAPPADFPLWLAEAHDAKPDVIATGFLPDEVDWHPAQLDVDWDWFIGRWVFLPFRFGTADPARSPDTVLHLTNPRSQADDWTTIIVGAFTSALGRSVTELQLSVASEVGEVQHALDRAAVVLDESDDWTLGFAIDDYAARSGRQILRLGRADYSPFRTALLGRDVPSVRMDRIRSGEVTLRSAFATMTRPSTERHMEPEARCLTGEDKAFWRALYARSELDAFWNDECPVGRRPIEVGWQGRPSAWAALGALPRTSLAEERRGLVWLAAAQKIGAASVAGLAGPVCVAGGSLLARSGDVWLKTVCATARGVPEMEAAITRWQLAGVRLAGGNRKPEPGSWENIHSDGCATGKGAESAVAYWTELMLGRGELAVPDLGAAAEWSRRFGEAGPLLRGATLLRQGRTAAAAAVWSGWTRQAGFRWPGGLAALLRGAKLTAADLLPLVNTLATAQTGGAAVAVNAVVALWYERRKGDLCRLLPEKSCHAELGCSLRLLAAEESAGTLMGSVRGLEPILSALAGDYVAVRRVWGTATADGAGTLLARSCLLLLWVAAPKSAKLLAEELAETLPDAAPYPLFLGALLAQLLGDCETATAALSRLGAIRPDFFLEERVQDPRWAWLAALLQLGGAVPVDHWRRLALARTPEYRKFLADFPQGTLALVPGWLALVDVGYRRNSSPPP